MALDTEVFSVTAHASQAYVLVARAVVQLVLCSCASHVAEEYFSGAAAVFVYQLCVFVWQVD